MASSESLLEFILSTTYESDVLHHRIRLWRSLVEERLFSRPSGEESSQEDIQRILARADREKGELPEHVEAVEAWMRTASSMTDDDWRIALEEIDDAIEKLPTVTIEVAFSPSREQREAIGDWLRRHVHPRIVMRIRINPTIVGGVVIIWNGVSFDFSLRSEISDVRTGLHQALLSAISSS